MPYHYGKTIINSKLRFDFSNLNPKYGRIEKEPFDIEIKIYCNGKKMTSIRKYEFCNISINNAIKKTFNEEIEKEFVFYAEENYNIKVKVFREKNIRRPKYIKTPLIIYTKRRIYLLKEEINLYYDLKNNQGSNIKLEKKPKKRKINHFD